VSLRDVNFGNWKAWRPIFIPGGALFLAAVVLLETAILPVSGPAVDFYYTGVFAAGTLLAWRFHSSRVLFALLTLFLAHRALLFFSGGHTLPVGPGRIAFEAVAFLLPINFLIFALTHERGIDIPAVAPRLGLLFIESVFVAVICRPGEASAPSILHLSPLNVRLLHSIHVPQVTALIFLSAFMVLLVRFFLYCKPVESGLLWSLAAAFVALQVGGIGHLASAYFATSGLILASSIIENSYVLAYHDELTTLPGRRAFNDALLRLKEPYTVAALDIDHFKSVNDTYGHETGDEVLRMVAAKLAHVTGGGVAFRVGGEEFSILFPGEPMRETMPHLEALRSEIEASPFRLRSQSERRQATHQTSERRKSPRRRAARPARAPARSGSSHQISVTVSIGAAEARAKYREVEQVVQAADKALYVAKQSGRNRVVTAAAERGSRSRSIA
jgi:diguanylate cyclase (GGDEF)-like protein